MNPKEEIGMMMLLKMFKVTEKGRSWRVSEKNIETLLHIMLFNGADKIVIEAEKER